MFQISDIQDIVDKSFKKSSKEEDSLIKRQKVELRDHRKKNKVALKLIY